MSHPLTVLAWMPVVYFAACLVANLLTNRRPRMASWRDKVVPRWDQSQEVPDKNHLAGNVSKLHASAFETPSPVRRPQPKVSDKAVYYPATYRDPDARPARREEDNGFGSYENN